VYQNGLKMRGAAIGVVHQYGAEGLTRIDPLVRTCGICKVPWKIKGKSQISQVGRDRVESVATEAVRAELVISEPDATNGSLQIFSPPRGRG
jgi:hypothetical protein